MTAARRVFQVWGSNTDVGKTLASAGVLCHLPDAWRPADRRTRSLYIKPVQTGAGGDEDARKVAATAAKWRRRRRTDVETVTLYRYARPVSPHLACAEQGEKPPADDELCARLEAELQRWAQSTSAGGVALVETAGGVLSPAPSASLQADVYRALRLPSLLVGDARLGGISATLSAYEALTTRGYEVPVVAMFGDALRNADAVRAHVDGDANHTRVLVLPPAPSPRASLHRYLARLEVAAAFGALTAAMERWHARRDARLRSMAASALRRVWWPFTQHGTRSEGDVLVIDSAFGERYSVLDGGAAAEREVVDGCGSWWTNGLGHGDARLSRAVARATSRYGHVIFPDAVHEPALELSERLLDSSRGVGAGWAARVFFSDNGSTGVEVALKMALRTRVRARHAGDYARASEMRIIAFQDSYHGDTLGVMACSPRSVFNERQTPWYSPRGVFLDAPTVRLSDARWRVSFADGDDGDGGSGGGGGGGEEPLASFEHRAQLFDVAARRAADARTADAYRRHFARSIAAERNEDALGALLMEPVVQGAGGMRLVDPLYQHVVADECRKRGIPVVLDEVFTGMWRLGALSGASIVDVKPDVAVYAKLLTGGVLPMAVTLAAPHVFEAFEGGHKRDALLHGHSYTAHAAGCAAANASLREYSRRLGDGAAHRRGRVREYWPADVASEISRLRSVAGVVNVGTILAVELHSSDAGYQSNVAAGVAALLMARGVYVRPLGNVVYVLCTPLATSEHCAQCATTLLHALREHAQLPSVS